MEVLEVYEKLESLYLAGLSLADTSSPEELGGLGPRAVSTLLRYRRLVIRAVIMSYPWLRHWSIIDWSDVPYRLGILSPIYSGGLSPAGSDIPLWPGIFVG